MNTTTRLLASFFVTALLGGCDSPAPETSSSSNWVTCKALDDCTVTGASACTGGYCVDSSGARLRVTSSQPGPCDPLSPSELPVTLGTVLGIGKATDGALYLADEVTVPVTTDRVFVSEGGTLVRRRVTGSGSNGGGADVDYNLSFEDGSGSTALLIQRRGGALTGIGLGSSGPKSFFGDPGAVTTPLAIADDSAIDGVPLRNLPGDVAIEYVADAQSGEVVVVTHPADDSTYDDFRIFFGKPKSATERRILDVVRARDGGSTTITFLVGAEHAVARFPWHLGQAPDGGVSSGPLPGDLDTGGGTVVPLIRRYPNPETLSGMSFVCF